jgi:hypothetical protein
MLNYMFKTSDRLANWVPSNVVCYSPDRERAERLSERELFLLRMVQYPNFPLAVKTVLHSKNLPVPEPPERGVYVIKTETTRKVIKQPNRVY